MADHGACGKVAYLTVSNQKKLNTLNSDLMREMLVDLARLAEDVDLRAVVIGGAGSTAFVGGANIDELQSFDGARGRAYITLCHECCDAVRNLPMPVIARLQGYTIGAGLELAVSCDLRVASNNAKFAMPEVKLGLPSVIEAALIPRLVGWGRARAIMLLGETFTAAEAADWGLVERTVDASDLDDAIETFVASILTADARAIRMQKALMRRWEDLPVAEAVQVGIDCFAEAWETSAPREAINAFIASEKARKGSAPKPQGAR